MALPSFATRSEPQRPAATDNETAAPAPPLFSAAALIARAKAILADRSDDRVAQIIAGKVFLLRVASAVLALLSQVLLARWMGRFDFGIYIYVWTWVLMIGALSDVGLSSATRRFIPEYIELKALDRLRGFLSGSRWLAFGIATGIAAAGALGVTLVKPYLDQFTVIPLYLACLTIPIYGLGQVQAGIAQSYDWPNLALMPFFVWRQFIITVSMGAAWALGAPTDAATAIVIAVATTWAVTLGQMVVLDRRLHRKVPPGPKRYEVKTWFATSLPIFVVEGFYLLLTYVDILVLEQMRSPDEVAVYYAAARLVALVAFVYFAIAGATTHKFTKYHVAGDRERLARFFAETIRWTFWPSLAACAAILVLGRPLLSLFGAGFTSGYTVMFILAVGRPKGCSTCWASASSAPPSMPLPSRSILRCACCSFRISGSRAPRLRRRPPWRPNRSCSIASPSAAWASTCSSSAVALLPHLEHLSARSRESGDPGVSRSSGCPLARA